MPRSAMGAISAVEKESKPPAVVKAGKEDRKPRVAEGVLHGRAFVAGLPEFLKKDGKQVHCVSHTNGQYK